MRYYLALDPNGMDESKQGFLEFSARPDDATCIQKMQEVCALSAVLMHDGIQDEIVFVKEFLNTGRTPRQVLPLMDPPIQNIRPPLTLEQKCVIESIRLATRNGWLFKSEDQQ